MSNFGDRLCELREEKELSMMQLAKELGMAHPNISRWESGKQEPTASNIIKLAQFFDVSTDYLLGLVDD